MEKLDVAYFPVVAEWARGEPGKLLGWLGSAVKLFGATALLFHPSALRIQFYLFGPGDGYLSIKIFVGCAARMISASAFI
jgi:hypothetical protein